jgi:hypothetical protein
VNLDGHFNYIFRSYRPVIQNVDQLIFSSVHFWLFVDPPTPVPGTSLSRNAFLFFESMDYLCLAIGAICVSAARGADND